MRCRMSGDILVFDRGFARAKYLMKPFMEAGIDFCKNSFYHNSQRIKLEMQKTISRHILSQHGETQTKPLCFQRCTP